MTNLASTAWRRTCRAARRLRREELGASALEWAIIAAVMVIAATLVGSVIYGIVDKRSTTLKNCSDTVTVSTKCDDGAGKTDTKPGG